jgi:hypothetical protein
MGGDGRNCLQHPDCCGDQVQNGSILRISHEPQLLYGVWRDSLALYLGGCKVGYVQRNFEQAHIFLHNQEVMVIDCYSRLDNDVERRKAVYKNHGFAIGEIVVN